ncbi:hypothetical protein KJ656_01890 [bacterium]|nr:hypothetical protein [bacterium]
METISLQINVGLGFDNFNSFESFLISSVRQGIMQEIKGYLKALDEELSCQFELEHPDYYYHGQVTRAIRFYYGEIQIKRRRYRCKGKKDIYPLDLFLPLGILSEKVTEIAIELSTEIPYARSSRLLQEILGVKVSGKGIWHSGSRRTERTGRACYS